MTIERKSKRVSHHQKIIIRNNIMVKCYNGKITQEKLYKLSRL